MPFVNLTGAPVTIVRQDGSVIAHFPHAPQVFIATAHAVEAGYVRAGNARVPVLEREWSWRRLPAYRRGTWLIVPAHMAGAVAARGDTFFPGPPIRDAQGRVLGVSGLVRAGDWG